MKKIIIELKKKIKFFFKKLNNFKENYSEPLTIYTNSDQNGPKIHLGSGEINLQGWINVDARRFKHTHIVDQDFQMKEFKDDSVSEIYLCHVLEHFSFNDANLLIQKFYKKLKKNGILRISVPDFSQLKKIYEEKNDLHTIKFALMGGQNYENDFHKSIYDKKNLSDILKKNHFKDVEYWDSEKDFGTKFDDWSDGIYSINGKNFKVSLNLKAIK